MAEGDAVYCEPCEHNGEMKSASTWCNDCEEGFCKACVKGHKITKLLRNHHLIPIADRAKIVPLSVSQNCDDHNKKIDFFCPQHDHILCLKCVQLHHSLCDVLELDAAATGTKSSTAISDLQDSINNILQNVQVGIQRCNKTANNLNGYEQEIKGRIKRIRETINKHLDTLQEKLMKEINLKNEKQQLQLSRFKTEFSDKEKNLRKFKEQISLMKKFSSDIQTFIGIKRLSKAVFEEKEVVKKSITYFPDCQNEFHIHPKLESFVKDVEMFGEIVVKENINSINYTEPKEKQAQRFYIPVVSKCTNVRVQLRQKLRITTGGKEIMVTSCVILPNKKLVFSDGNNMRLIIHNEDGSFQCFIKLPDHPFDITVLNEDTVAVSYRPQNKCIDEVNTRTLKIKEIMSDSLNQSYWGISRDDENLYIVAYPKGIEMINLPKKALKAMSINVHNVFNLTAHRNKIYYTNKASNTVHCCDASGNGVWRFCNEILKSSSNSLNSLTSDNNGNIYVTCPNEDIVILIFNDGKRYEIMLDGSDKLENPRGIFFDKGTNQLLVCNQENGFAAVYGVSYV